jgi:hypothetical protein
MTGWKRAWGYVTKPSKRRFKKWLKNQNHRANRRAGKALSDRHIPLDPWEVY